MNINQMATALQFYADGKHIGAANPADLVDMGGGQTLFEGGADHAGGGVDLLIENGLQARIALGLAVIAPTVDLALLRECRASGQISDAQWVQHCQEHPELAVQPIADVQAEALQAAIDALEEIAMAGMSGSGQESEEGMRDWHARRAWEFIGIAARALGPAKAATVAHRQQQAAAKGGE